MSTWTKRGLVALAVVVLLASSFGAGRFSAPATVKEVEKRVEVHHETQVVKQEVDMSKVMAMLTQIAAKKNVVTVREVVRAADGTVTERTRTEDKSETNTVTKADEKTASKTASESSKTMDRTTVVEKTKLVERLRQPDWLLGAQVGLSLPALAGADVKSYVPGLPKMVGLGLTVDRRILGSTYLGLYATSRLEVGASLRVGF